MNSNVKKNRNQVDLFIDWDTKNRLAYNKFTYKKTKDDCKLEDRFRKKPISALHICKISDKKTEYNQILCNT